MEKIIDEKSRLCDVVELVKWISNSYENLTETPEGRQIKKKYIQENFDKFKQIGQNCSSVLACFATGYPFYNLDLFKIPEQIRYDNELETHFTSGKEKEEPWRCGVCLKSNGKYMRDLKEMCYICPTINAHFRPRKLLNRLPDNDVWFLYNDMDSSKNFMKKNNRDLTQFEITQIMNGLNLETSDNDPIATINKMSRIVDSLNNGIIPEETLPVDVHIVGMNNLMALVSKTPEVIDDYFELKKNINLKIHPDSLRKDWDFDNEGYSFVFDFLYSMALVPLERNNPNERSLETSLVCLVNDVRHKIAEKYSNEQILEVLYALSSDATKRRFESQPELQKQLFKKIDGWRTYKFEENNWVANPAEKGVE